ncbi:MAG: DNA-binding response regulator [Candidatus Kapaibacterium sp.]|nr:MAG: DNA-binding response regulator [Candidatus Kapabacteria bacterium]
MNTIPNQTRPSFYSQTILLVSDSGAVAQAMEQFIFSGLQLRVAARLHTFDNLEDAVRRFVPDVAIAYFNALDTERIRQIRRIALAAPHVGILVIAPTTTASLVQEVFSAGARGYLLDMPSREELISALDRMRERGTAVDERLRGDVSLMR